MKKILLPLLLFFLIGQASSSNQFKNWEGQRVYFVPAKDGWFSSTEYDVDKNNYYKYIPLPRKAMKKDLENILENISKIDSPQIIEKLVQISMYRQVQQALLKNKNFPYQLFKQLLNTKEVDKKLLKSSQLYEIYNTSSELSVLHEYLNSRHQMIKLASKEKLLEFISKSNDLKHLNRYVKLKILKNDDDIKIASKDRFTKLILKIENIEELLPFINHTDKDVKNVISTKIDQIVSKLDIDTVEKYINHSNEKIKKSAINRLKTLLTHVDSIETLESYLVAYPKSIISSAENRLISLLENTKEQKIISKYTKSKYAYVLFSNKNISVANKLELLKNKKIRDSYIHKKTNHPLSDEILDYYLSLNNMKYDDDLIKYEKSYVLVKNKDKIFNRSKIYMDKKVYSSNLISFIIENDEYLKKIFKGKAFINFQNELLLSIREPHKVLDYRMAFIQEKKYELIKSSLKEQLSILNEYLKKQKEYNKDKKFESSLYSLTVYVVENELNTDVNILDTISNLDKISSSSKFKLMKLLYENNYDLYQFRHFKDKKSFIKFTDSFVFEDKCYMFYKMHIEDVQLGNIEKIYGYVKYTSAGLIIFLYFLLMSALTYIIFFRRLR
jgi:hypothetical protein